jgi:hypothetical protein
MATLNSYGLVILTSAELSATSFLHLLSGVDEDHPSATALGATPTAITGHTEWLSNVEPRLTLGWDWQLTARDGQVQLCRIGLPRSNFAIDDSSLHNAGQVETLSKNLEQFVDRFAWQDTVLAAIGWSAA